LLVDVEMRARVVETAVDPHNRLVVRAPDAPITKARFVYDDAPAAGVVERELDGRIVERNRKSAKPLAVKDDKRNV
jgi:hypothetical protein